MVSFKDAKIVVNQHGQIYVDHIGPMTLDQANQFACQLFDTIDKERTKQKERLGLPV